MRIILLSLAWCICTVLTFAAENTKYNKAVAAIIDLVGQGGPYGVLQVDASKKHFVESDHIPSKELYAFSKIPELRAIAVSDMGCVSLPYGVHRDKIISTGTQLDYIVFKDSLIDRDATMAKGITEKQQEMLERALLMEGGKHEELMERCIHEYKNVLRSSAKVDRNKVVYNFNYYKPGLRDAIKAHVGNGFLTASGETNLITEFNLGDNPKNDPQRSPRHLMLRRRISLKSWKREKDIQSRILARLWNEPRAFKVCRDAAIRNFKKAARQTTPGTISRTVVRRSLKKIEDDCNGSAGQFRKSRKNTSATFVIKSAKHKVVENIMKRRRMLLRSIRRRKQSIGVPQELKNR